MVEWLEMLGYDAKGLGLETRLGQPSTGKL